MASYGGIGMRRVWLWCQAINMILAYDALADDFASSVPALEASGMNA